MGVHGERYSVPALVGRTCLPSFWNEIMRADLNIATRHSHLEEINRKDHNRRQTDKPRRKGQRAAGQEHQHQRAATSKQEGLKLYGKIGAISSLRRNSNTTGVADNVFSTDYPASCAPLQRAHRFPLSTICSRTHTHARVGLPPHPITASACTETRGVMSKTRP